MGLANLKTKSFETEYRKNYGLGGVLYKHVTTKNLTGKMRGEVVTFPAIGDDIVIVKNRPNNTPLTPNFPDGAKAEVELDTDMEIRVDFRRSDASESFLNAMDEYSKGVGIKRDLEIDKLIAERAATSTNLVKTLAPTEIVTGQDAYDFTGTLIGLVLAELPKGLGIKRYLEVDFYIEKLLKDYYRHNITANTALFEKDGQLFFDSFEISRTPALYNDGDDIHLMAYIKDAIGFCSSLSDIKDGFSDSYNSDYIIATDNMGANVINSKYVATGLYHPETV